MNKIYRTIYNETTGTWVAVEETAKSHRKSNGGVVDNTRASVSGSLKKISVIAAVAAMVSPFMAETAQADILCRVNSGGKLFIRTGPNCNRGETKVIPNANNPDDFIDPNADVERLHHDVNAPTLKKNDDESLVVQNNTAVLQDGTIDLGYRGSIYRVSNNDYRQDGTFQRTGLNQKPGSKGKTDVILKAETSGATGDHDIAIGTNATAHGNRKSKEDLDFDSPGSYKFDVSGYYEETGGTGHAIAIGQESQAVREGAIAVGNKAMAGQNAIAIGNNMSRAVTPNSIAIGDAGVRGNSGVNTSLDDPSNGGDSIALGNNASNWTYGIGGADYDWYANSKNSVAIGHRAHTHAANAFAIGTGTDALGERSFAIGTVFTQNAVDETTESGAINHKGSLASGQGSIIIGDQARSGFKRDNTEAPDPNNPDKPIGEGAITNINANDSVAIGTGSLVSARNALALGGGISYTYHKITDTNGSKTMNNISRYYVQEDGEEKGNWIPELDHEEFLSIGAKVGKYSDGAIALGGASADISGANSTLYPTTEAKALKVKNYVKAAEVAQNAKRAIAIGGGTFVDEKSIGAVALGGEALSDATRSKVGKRSSNSFAAVGGKVKDDTTSAIALGENATVASNSNGSVALGGLTYTAKKSEPPQAKDPANPTTEEQQRINEYVAKYGAAGTFYIIDGTGSVIETGIKTQDDANVLATNKTNAHQTIIAQQASNSFAAIGGKVGQGASGAIAMGNKSTVEANSEGSVALGGRASEYSSYEVKQSAPPMLSGNPTPEERQAYDDYVATYGKEDSYYVVGITNGKETVVAKNFDTVGKANDKLLEQTQETTIVDVNATNAFAAVGGKVKSGAEEAISMGVGSYAKSKRSIAVGAKTIAEGIGTVAIGSGEDAGNKSGAYAVGNGNIAIGKRAEATGAGVTYSQDGNYVYLPQNNANDDDGHHYTYNRTLVGGGTQQIAIGDNASSYGNQSIALGGNTLAGGYAAIAVGGDDVGLDTKRGQNVIDTLKALNQTLLDNGYDQSKTLTNTIGNNTTAFRDITTAKGDASMALGFKSVAQGNLSNAVGMGARTMGENSVAFGTVSTAGGANSIAVGTVASTGGGYFDEQGNSLTQTISYTDKNGDPYTGAVAENSGKFFDTNGDELTRTISYTDKSNQPYTGTVTKGAENAVAVGYMSQVGGSLNVDDVSKVGITNAKYSVNGTEQDLDLTSKSGTGVNSVAVGERNKVLGANSTAVGQGNIVLGDNSGAFGDPNTVTGSGSYAYGNNNTIGAHNAFVLGNRVTKTADNSVFLGADTAYVKAADNLTVDNARTTAGIKQYATNAKAIKDVNGKEVIAANTLNFAGAYAYVDNTDPSNPVTYAVFKDGNDYVYYDNGGNRQTIDLGSLKNSVVGVVSVGDKGQERRIQNVAAGLIDPSSTDAINGSQLYSVVQNIASGSVRKFAGDDKGTTAATDEDNHIAVVDGGAVLDIVGGVDTTKQLLTEGNIGVVYGNSHTLKVKLSDNVDLTNAGSLTVGNDGTNSTGTVIKPNEINFTVVNDNPTGKVTGLKNNLTVAETTATVAPALPDPVLINNAATVSDVLNAGWNLQVEKDALDFVKHNDTVIFVSPDKSVKVSGSRDGTKDTLNFQVNTADKHTANADGTVSAPTTPTDETQFWDATETANAINAAAWNIQGKNGNTVAADTKAIKAGSKVDLVAAGGLKLTQTNNDNGTELKLVNDMKLAGDEFITVGGDAENGYTLNFDESKLPADKDTVTKVSAYGKVPTDNNYVGESIVANVTTDADGNPIYDVKLNNVVTVGDSTNGSDKPIKIDGTTGNITLGNPDGSNIFNVATHINSTDGSLINPSAPTNQAASVQDVLNSGWNLQVGSGSTASTEYIKHNEQVAFVDGTGTTVSGSKAGVSYNVNTATLDPVTNGTVSVTNTTTTGNNYLTAADTATAINSAYWIAKDGGAGTANVHAGDEVTLKPATGENNIQVALTPTTGGGGAYEFSLKPAISLTGNANGTITAGTNTGDILNAGQVADAINLAGWVVGKGSSADSTNDRLVQPSNRVGLVEGNGVSITQSNTNFTFALKDDYITNTVKPLTFTGDDGTTKLEPAHGENVQVQGVATTTGGANKNITVTATPKTASTGNSLDIALAPNVDLGDTGWLKVGKAGTGGDQTTINPNEITFTDDKGKITGLDNHFADSAGKNSDPNTTPVAASHNAATVSDVLNAGWNLQNNDNPKDFVAHGDTLNFVDGDNTKVVIDTTGTTSSKIKVNVTTADLTSSNVPTYTEGKVAIVDSEKTKPITAGDVVEIANNVAWNVQGSANGGTLTGTREKQPVKAGDTVDLVAGEGVILNQENGKFTFSVDKDKVNTDSVTTLTVDSNFKLDDNGTGNNHEYDLKLNDVITVGDNATGKPITINGITGDITLGDTAGSNIYNVATHINSDGTYTTPTDQAASVQDVLNSGWNLQVKDNVAQYIKHGDTVKFVDGTGTTVSDDKGGIAYNVNKAGNSTVDSGRVVAPDNSDNKFWDANQTATAVNSAYWIAKANNAQDTGEQISAGDDVIFKSSDNSISVARAGNEFDFKVDTTAVQNAAKPLRFKGDDTTSNTILMPTFNEIVNVVGGETVDKEQSTKNISVTAVDGDTDAKQLVLKLAKDVDLGKEGSLKIGDTKVQNNKIDFGTDGNDPQGRITNLASHIKQDGSPVDGTNFHTDQAASVQDVLNAGWNIANNGEHKNLVQHQNTVDFVNSETAGIVVEKKGDTASEVKVNVAKVTSGSPDYITVTGGTVNKDGTVDDYVLTFDDSAIKDAIGDASFTLTSSNKGVNTGKKAEIKKGSTVTINGGSDNIEIAQTGGTITVDVAKDVKFDSVETGTLKAGDTKLGDNFEVKGGKVTYNQTPTDDNEVVNKKYADSLGWDLKVNGTKQGDTITNGEAVNFANGDNTTVKFEDNAVKVSVNTTALTAADGKVVDPTTGGNNLTTAQNVADMINQTYWIASDGSNKTNVSAGNTVKWTGGKYTDVALSGDTFTVKSTLDIQQDATTGDVVIKDGDTVLANIAKGSDTVTSVAAGDNITVTPDMTDPNNPKYTVALNPNVDLGDSGSLKTGDTLVNNDGITINNGSQGKPVTLTKDGLNNGGNKITNVAAGVDDTDAVNVGQLNDAITNVGTTINNNVNKVVYGKDNPTDEEKENWLKTYNATGDGVYKTNSVATAIHHMNELGIKFFHTNDGNPKEPTPNGTSAEDSQANGKFATAIGYQAQAGGQVIRNGETYTGQGTGENAIALGNGAAALGDKSISIGAGNIVTGVGSTAIGDPNIITGSGSHALGNENTISTNNTHVVGNNVKTTADNSVFLGNNTAYTAAGASTAGTEAYATNHEDIKDVNGNVVIAKDELKFAGSHDNTGVVSVGDVGNERRIQNVAPGKLSADSTDAINGSQLYSVAQKVGQVSSGGAGIVQYSNPDDPTTPNGGVATNDVTLVGADKAAPVTIHNVAAGRAPTDAVNVSQLNQAVGDIHNRMDNMSKHADASAASAIAVASMPQAFLPGKNLVAIGGGTYHGQTGYAIGVSTISDNGHWIVKGTATGNSKNRYGAGIGAGYQW